MGSDAYFRTDLTLSITDRVQAYLASVTRPKEYNGFETHPVQQITLQSVDKAAQGVVYSLNVPPSLCNKDGNLHGGAATTLLDNLSSTALLTVAKPGYWETLGVSRSLYVVFHRPVPDGSVATLQATVVSAGKRMCTLKAEIRTEAGLLCVSCLHEKVGLQAPGPRL